MSGVKEKLKARLEERDIDTLYHFTNVKNLKSITKDGIKPRSELDLDEVFINDTKRFDGRIDTVSLSSGHPQQKMLSRCRYDNPDEFAIIEIDANLLIEGDGDVLFSPKNAACKEISTSSDDDLKSIESFDKMFADPDDTRASSRLTPKDPTDVQAEFLYRGTIAPKYMKHVQFSTRSKKKAYKPDLSGISSSVADPKHGIYTAREERRKLGIK